MRKANDSKFLITDSVLIGINLGADFTAEHEWGIRGIKKLFGIDPKDDDFGLKRRKITRVPDSITFGWTKGKMPKSEGFYLLETWDGKIPNFSQNGELYTYRDALACAWDGDSFGVFSTDSTKIGYLHEIYDAFLNGDGAIFMGGGNRLLGGGGLILCIASRISKEFTDGWEKADREAYEMEQEVKQTGIRELLVSKQKRYLALSRPHHREKDGKLTFWLNPMEQHENNYGWFTIDDLREWADGNGKIPKAANAGKG